MIRVHTDGWTRQIGRVLQPVLKCTGKLLEHDMMDSKWGHRVLDQVFREGKFSSPQDENRVPGRKAGS